MLVISADDLKKVVKTAAVQFVHEVDPTSLTREDGSYINHHAFIWKWMNVLGGCQLELVARTDEEPVERDDGTDLVMVDCSDYKLYLDDRDITPANRFFGPTALFLPRHNQHLMERQLACVLPF